MTFNPHIHALATEGLVCSDDTFLPVPTIDAQPYLEAGFGVAHDAGKHPDQPRPIAASFLLFTHDSGSTLSGTSPATSMSWLKAGLTSYPRADPRGVRGAAKAELAYLRHILEIIRRMEDKTRLVACSASGSPLESLHDHGDNRGDPEGRARLSPQSSGRGGFHDRAKP